MNKKLKYTATGVISAIVLLIVWGFIEPRFLNTKEEVATIPNLPDSWEGKQIGQLSDFQIGLWGDNVGTARRSVEQMIEAAPAAVLISGDFIYHAKPNPEEEIREAVDIVRPLVEAGIPTYAVLGNHDYGMSDKKAEPDTQLANSLKSELEAAGIPVLENESVVMQLPDSDEPLYLAAVDSLWADRDNAEAALADIPANSPSIALMHNPDSFELFPANTAPLAVAGHTHGGQMRVPYSPQWSWLRFTQKDKVYADGWAKGYGKPGNNLYVNIGIGMSIVPMRIFCPPEMTLFTLER
ncbi:metallophosphoesterase [cf. Phormidesmis sp. LEGE 11477]|uniref:metallophosphoesterase n=1 Tax=cf. Phormidesmis sp. LEGE 11477 TaxID=1828680 RepID=UPI0018824872|nr:metallophosphoesterase [cf. Phormidesmis sp. LEGE 11477]MBE9059431.1 metallophosphoesterase [cf. Phormidesmis sp. LEGE 11477]